jgi:hypothetical protein
MKNNIKALLITFLVFIFVIIGTLIIIIPVELFNDTIRAGEISPLSEMKLLISSARLLDKAR